MFLDEARLAAGIHHPNVVPILEVGTSEAGYYLVMDYIEGDTLSGVTARSTAHGGMPRSIALRIVIDSLLGLHAAHELTDADGFPVDLVHRDCSPQNILVGLDGSSRLTDFGVAAPARASRRRATPR
ncbi:MAG: protein kinase [Polyangiaceae bacterium]